MRGSEDGALRESAGDDPGAGRFDVPRSPDDPESFIAWFGEIPDHAAISVGTSSSSGDVVLAARPVAFQPHPNPSDRIAPWLSGALDDPTTPLGVHNTIGATITDPTGDRPSPPLLLDANPDVRDEIENAVLRQLGDMVPERPSDTDEG